MRKELKQYSVVSVPFPFIDRKKSKKRPALILSSQIEFNQKIGHSVMAMITSLKNSPWPLDVKILDLKDAGLPAPSVIRMKLFTMDNSLIQKNLGQLSPKDQLKIRESLQKLFPITEC